MAKKIAVQRLDQRDFRHPRSRQSGQSEESTGASAFADAGRVEKTCLVSTVVFSPALDARGLPVRRVEMALGRERSAQGGHALRVRASW